MSGWADAADLTVQQHVPRDDAPGSGRCKVCEPDGSCRMLSWAVWVQAGERVPYPGDLPAAPQDLQHAA